MARVELQINGRVYDVACDDGQEDRLRTVSEHVDSVARDLASGAPTASEAYLLLLTTLVLGDQLIDARSEGGNGDGGNPELGRSVEDLAKRIEAIASRLERA